MPNTTKYTLKLLVISILAILSLSSVAQDIQFSQFYAVTPYQNPAFTGGAHKNRFILHQRLQWPGLEAKYSSSFASFDTYLRNFNSGLGGFFLRDIQGKGYINSTEIQLQYAYEWHINSQLSARGGLQAGYVTRSVDYSHLIFSTQFDDDGYVGAANPANFGNEKIQYGDISAGGLLYTSQFWLGYASHHLNLPNLSVFSDVSRLPTTHAFTMGYKYLIDTDTRGVLHGSEREVAIIPTFHYKFQGKSDQFDAGVYFIYNQFMAGVWYRGIPAKKFLKSLPNNESFILLAGFRFQELMEFRYSYDITISKLAPARTGGSHEFNLVIYWPSDLRTHKHPTKRLPCPRFVH